jgi:hypothetical protein
MLRWFIRRKLDTEEKRLGASMDYLRHIVDVSPVAFLRFASIMPFSNSRSVLPKDAWFVAQLLTLQHEDCGACLQISVNLAQNDGVEASLIRAVLAHNKSALSEEMVDVYDFTRFVIDATADDGVLRETLRKRYGERGLIELAYAIASSQIPPTVKRAMGYATSCSKVDVTII